MGCDIHTYVEQRNENGNWEAESDLEPFDSRDYSVFGWLAGVRNYSAVTPLDDPRGLPEHVSAHVREQWDFWGSDAHSTSWFSVDELLAFDYDQQMEDRRIGGRHTAEPGGGGITTYREFLGALFFADLALLESLNAKHPTRVVFWFDN